MSGDIALGSPRHSSAWIEAEGYDYETEEGLSLEGCLADALDEVSDYDGVSGISVTRDPVGFSTSAPSSASAPVVYTRVDDDGERVGFTGYIGWRGMDRR